jgi:aspartyl-tRNA(Asn)/glutamyl-tRNA(Gln) amidotransferase subunit C
MKKYEMMAKLDLPEDERQWIAGQAERLLESFSALDHIDTNGVEPLVTVLDAPGALREDAAVKTITRDKLLSNAPEQYGGYFQVPRTIE